MKKVKQVSPYENILLKFFTKIGKLPLLEYREAFRELRQKLFPINEKSLITEDILGYIDYKEWIEGKINGH